MRVLLSIKPEFAERIFDGSKAFEFRRSIFKNPDVRSVVVYASFPKMKIIGEFEIDTVIESTIDELWQTTESKAGISENYFYSYFIGKERGFAIKIKNPKRYKIPKCITTEFGMRPPQSFAYLR